MGGTATDRGVRSRYHRSKKLYQREYQSLIEQAPIMIWRSNAAAECDYFNERWLSFRGRTLKEESGNQWTEGVHPTDLPHCLSTYLEAFEKREPFEMEYRLRRHDGVYRWICDRGTPFFRRNQKFRGYIGSCTDITERIQAQEALEEERNRELADLRGILPICMGCKMVRRTDGAWEQLEHYIRDHSRADISHGLCPQCHELYRRQVDELPPA